MRMFKIDVLLVYYLVYTKYIEGVRGMGVEGGFVGGEVGFSSYLRHVQ